MEVVEKWVSIPSVNPALGANLQRRLAAFAPRFTEEWGGKFVTHGRRAGPNAVRLDGNDYLAITGHPAIVQAQLDSLRHDREFVIQSGVFHLDGHPAGQLEHAIAHWIGKDNGYICQSGYTANLGLLQVAADPQTPVYMDMLAHMSLWEGARASGAPVHPFRHNDPAHLAKMAARHGPGLVVVDSVYSTTGALCPLTAIVETARAAWLHDPGGQVALAWHARTAWRRSLCRAGPDAPGALHHGQPGQGLCRADQLLTAPPELRHYLMCHSFPGIFSSALCCRMKLQGWQPHWMSSSAATMPAPSCIRNTRRLRRSLAEQGLRHPPGQRTDHLAGGRH